MANTIIAKAGNTTPINFTLMNNALSPAVPIDITGATLFFTVKVDISDSDANALISKKWSPVTGGGFNTTLGQTQLILSAADMNLNPGGYFWDIRFIDTYSDVENTDRGAFNVEDVVTERIT